MKPRLHPYVSHDNYVRLRAMAARPGETESAIVDRALSAFFAGHHDDKRDAAIIRRLDRLTRQFDRLERNDLILNELTALFVRYFLTVTPPLPPSQMEAARAQGSARFERFVETLGRDLRAGRRLLQRAMDEIVADESDFLTEAELDRLHQPAPAKEKSDA
jgi:hypothetical protein